MFFFDSLIVGRGLGSFTAPRFAFRAVSRRELRLTTNFLVSRTAAELIGRTKFAFAGGTSYAAAPLSDVVRVSCPRIVLTVVGSGSRSSPATIDAVTLVANNPPISARLKAAIQTVLVNLAPDARSRVFATVKNEFNQP
ncbi:hypothetical protein SAMN05444169_6854 [Bradyrhizobium erythrophlei]|uniref:Uncharacterized protein n=1 Tax=Bradyrhizobium erythrophlei TaxID=1437360 RepID=A0A1M5RZF1_9BRAD|nr:hypothetical protein SAMN05444169_6854 [Bradyrhizobium erythrophlei]